MEKFNEMLSHSLVILLIVIIMLLLVILAILMWRSICKLRDNLKGIVNRSNVEIEELDKKIDLTCNYEKYRKTLSESKEAGEIEFIKEQRLEVEKNFKHSKSKVDIKDAINYLSFLEKKINSTFLVDEIKGFIVFALSVIIGFLGFMGNVIGVEKFIIFIVLDMTLVLAYFFNIYFIVTTAKIEDYIYIKIISESTNKAEGKKNDGITYLAHKANFLAYIDILRNNMIYIKDECEKIDIDAEKGTMGAEIEIISQLGGNESKVNTKQ